MRHPHEKSFRHSVACLALVALAFAAPVAAAPLIEPLSGAAELETIYSFRTDLRAAFSGDARVGNERMRSAGMLTLEDWARRYGYKEHPEALAAYAPLPPSLRPIESAAEPMLRPGAAFDYDSVSASSVHVVDMASRKVLMSRNAAVPHPLASISKLVTAMVVLDRKPVMAKRYAVTPADEVAEPGAVRIAATRADSFSVLELLNVTLVTSANNTANALARTSGLSRPQFIEAMNAKATEIGLRHTVLEDPTGIEVGNVSTAQEIAAIGIEAFGRDAIRRATTTSRYGLALVNGRRTYSNTNDVLNDPYNGILVLGGKTGYLIESKWNLVVKMRGARNEPDLMVVVLGSASKAQAKADVEKVAKWAWANYVRN